MSAGAFAVAGAVAGAVLAAGATGVDVGAVVWANAGFVVDGEGSAADATSPLTARSTERRRIRMSSAPGMMSFRATAEGAVTPYGAHCDSSTEFRQL